MGQRKYPERIEKLLQNVERRLYYNDMKARYGLEMAERLMDEDLLKRGMTRYTPQNPYENYFSRVYQCWDYLNQKK